jgi:hypothetical protein
LLARCCFCLHPARKPSLRRKQEGAEFEKNFQALKAEVQLHFTEEENEIFPQVTSLKGGPDLGRLAEQLAANKKEYQSTQGSLA